MAILHLFSMFQIIADSRIPLVRPPYGDLV